MQNKREQLFLHKTHHLDLLPYQIISKDLKGLFVCSFCCFMSEVNSYGHGGTVSSPNHTFFLGKLEQAVIPVLCAHTFACN